MPRIPFHATLLAITLFLMAALPGCTLLNHGEPLPAQMKGYELYTWDDASQTWFTLISGTNRVKTPAEVIAPAREVITSDGYVAITVAGLDALANWLDRLPVGESVIVTTVSPTTGDTLEAIPTPPALADALRTKAATLGLNLNVTF